MHIMIFEDGRLMKSGVIEESELEAADDGAMEIIFIDPDDSQNPLQYYNGNWHEIEDHLG